MPGKNEGEGSRTAARRYNEGASKSAEKNTKVDARPKSDEERREMEEAEKAGRQRAKEIDPAEDRDFDRPTK
jgi:hypothetical protein